MASEFPVPYHHDIADFKLPSKVQLIGAVKEGAQRFEINLRSGTDEFLFHFNPRFGENCVVRSSTKDGQQWQTEEREGGMPFAVGKPFHVEMVVEESAITVTVNGSPFCQFAARDDLGQVTALEVAGDVQLNSVSVLSLGGQQPAPVDTPAEGGRGPRGEESGGAEFGQPEPQAPPAEPHPPTPAAPAHPQPAPAEPAVPGPQGQLPVPYQAPLQQLAATNRMRVVGIPHPGAQRFTVNWKSDDGEALFHFNARLDQNCVVRNATVAKQYPPEGEEREGGGCPFQPGKQFALDFLIHGDVVRCFVDGIEFCRFQARGNLSQATLLDIHGDLALTQVLIA